jgi:hypothetical protein
MSADLKTLEGTYFETGFWGSDTTQVQLGELPSISIDQFSGFSAETVRQLVPLLLPDEQVAIKERLQLVRQTLAEIPTRELPSLYTGSEDAAAVTHAYMDKSNTETERALAGEGVAKVAAASQGHVWAHYRNNPFVVHNGTVVIGGSYQVGSVEFVHWTLDQLEGESWGWPPALGAPQSAFDALEKIDESFWQYENDEVSV